MVQRPQVMGNVFSWPMAMITCIAFAPYTHVCTYMCVRHMYGCLLSVGIMDWGPPFCIALSLPLKSRDCHASRLLCAASAPKMARARAWLSLDAAQIVLLLFNLYNSGRALHMLDTFWLKPELYDATLPMDTLHALSVFCMCDIAIDWNWCQSVCAGLWV